MQFAALPERLVAIRAAIDAAARRGGHGQAVRIVAVTKTHGPEAVDAAFQAGLGDVGENRVQEALDKMGQVTASVRWHLIGHLQRNKARHSDRFDLVHSVDSLRLADAIHEVGVKRGRPIPVLLQVNVSGEGTKGGFSPAELQRAVGPVAVLDGITVCGVMTMAPFGAPESVLRTVFGGARECGRMLRDAGIPSATELSMGMSGDYEVAVEEGATMIRLGTILFGERH